jgi:hypothetical protein
LALDELLWIQIWRRLIPWLLGVNAEAHGVRVFGSAALDQVEARLQLRLGNTRRNAGRERQMHRPPSVPGEVITITNSLGACAASKALADRPHRPF